MTARDRRVYLDHNATAPLLPEARAATLGALDLVGNPSSVHSEGRRARSLVEQARRQVAALVGAEIDAVVFASGATEAANTCLTPEWSIGGSTARLAALAVADTDHPATRDGGRFDPAVTTRLPVDAAGRVRIDALDTWIAGIDADRPAMIALALANNETGVIQPVAEIGARLAGTKILLVLDAVQAAGRLPLDIAALGADAILLSGHKLGAPKGVGAYVLRDARRRPTSLIVGGGQERRHRAGTEAVALIAGFGAAAEVAAARLSRGAADALSALREHLVAGLRRTGDNLQIAGGDAFHLPNTVAIAVAGLRAETAQIALDLDGFAVSSGSACSSGKVGPSHVLRAMAEGGAPIDPYAGAIRVSFGYETTESDIDLFIDAFARLVRRAEATDGGKQAA